MHSFFFLVHNFQTIIYIYAFDNLSTNGCDAPFFMIVSSWLNQASSRQREGSKAICLAACLLERDSASRAFISLICFLIFWTIPTIARRQQKKMQILICDSARKIARKMTMFRLSFTGYIEVDFAQKKIRISTSRTRFKFDGQ